MGGCGIHQELYIEETNKALIWSFWRLPLLWLATILIRAICICGLNPLFRLAGARARPPVLHRMLRGHVCLYADACVHRLEHVPMHVPEQRPSMCACVFARLCTDAPSCLLLPTRVHVHLRVCPLCTCTARMRSCTERSPLY